MVHLAVATSQARDRLLAAAVDQAMNGGIADLSLRELASAVGTSHRMLLYHFGSREGLLVAVTNAATGKGGVPAATLDLVHLRASQVNGCNSCVNSGSIATINLFNRLNVTTRQVAGGTWG